MSSIKQRKYVIDWNETTVLIDGRRGIAEVEGTPIKFSGFEKFDLFVATRPDGRFAVSEATTGMCASATGGHSTRRRAIREARKNLASVTPAKFSAMLRNQRRLRRPEFISGVIAQQKAAKQA